MRVQVLRRKNGWALRWRLDDGRFRLVSLGHEAHDGPWTRESVVETAELLAKFLRGENGPMHPRTYMIFGCLAEGFSYADTVKIMGVVSRAEKQGVGTPGG